jgi:PAS domain S-box-containing protein
MATLTQLWRGFTAPVIPADTDPSRANRQRLAYRMSLVALLTSVFFVLYNWVAGQGLLTRINLSMTGCYLAALLLLRVNRAIGKTLLVAGVSMGIFLVSSVVGKVPGNHLLYFPVICGIFLLFSIKELPALVGHLALPVAGLLVLQWTDYSLLAAYRAAAANPHHGEVNLVVSLVTMGLALYYAQHLNLAAEKALRESQQSLLAIIENTTNAIWSIDRNYRVITCNSTLKNEFRYGYGVEIEKGINIFDGISPEEKVTWYEICRRVFSGERFVQEMHYEFPGRTFDVEVAANPIKGMDGTVIGASFFSKNITKRKKVEATLRFHANVLAQVNDAVIGLDNDERITYWNTGAERLYGLAAEAAMGKKPEDVYRLEWLRPEDAQLARQLLAGTDAFTMEVIHVLADGRRIYVDTNTHTWYDENGAVIGLLAVNRDITESKQAEETIRATNQKLTAILENSQNIIFAVDRDYRYLAFNHLHHEAIRRLYNVDIHLGMSLRDFPGDAANDRNKIFGYLDRALAGEQFIVVEPFGNVQLMRRYYEHAFTPMRDDQGNVVGVTAFSLDISERIEAEEELRRINFELDSFVYRSSHDLRAPLRSVLGLVSLVRMEGDAGQRDYYLRLMEKSIDKLDTFIRDMTDFSRNSRQEVQAVPVDFRAIIAECADNLRYMENADRVALRVTVEGEGFCSDPQRINTVFQNLMSNSVKYQRLHSSDAFIEFRIHCGAREARIVYTDNGKGIDNAHLDKIFDMFFRASADSYGSGLGLYITRQVVKKLNGTIRVQSELGLGTQFSITLPNLRATAAAIAPVLPPPAR